MFVFVFCFGLKAFSCEMNKVDGILRRMYTYFGLCFRDVVYRFTPAHLFRIRMSCHHCSRFLVSGNYSWTPIAFLKEIVGCMNPLFLLALHFSMNSS